VIRFVRHTTPRGEVHCVSWICFRAGEEVFAFFWAQIAIAACLKALHVGEQMKAEVMPLNPPWENSPWQHSTWGAK
jgi:hypothetical protein